MNDTVHKFLVLKKKLENENREELLKYIASCKAKITEKDIENDTQKYISDYKALLSKSNKEVDQNLTS